VREDTGLGLKEAKTIVDTFNRGEPIRLPQQHVTGDLPADVIAAIEAGNTIDAIRILREQTGMDLKSAKTAVDAHIAAASPAGAAPREVKSGCMPLLVVALGVVTATVSALI
jgi:ribosomal protein L7/L12